MSNQSDASQETVRAVIEKMREREAYAHERQRELLGTQLGAWWQGVRDQANDDADALDAALVGQREPSSDDAVRDAIYLQALIATHFGGETAHAARLEQIANRLRYGLLPAPPQESKP